MNEIFLIYANKNFIFKFMLNSHSPKFIHLLTIMELLCMKRAIFVALGENLEVCK